MEESFKLVHLKKALEDSATCPMDSNLYSRQLYVFNEKNMQNVQSSKVLIYGAGSVGVEIGKNLLLSGINYLTFLDHNLVEVSDICSNFCCSEADVGKHRCDAARTFLQELNPTCRISVIVDDIADPLDVIKNYHVCVLTETLEIRDLHKICDFCHDNKIPLILVDSYGFYGRIFCDFGPTFVINDATGIDSTPYPVKYIDIGEEGFVQIYSDDQPEIGVGDDIEFTHDPGSDLDANKITRQVISTITKDTFQIGDTHGLEEFQTEGYIRLVKTPVTMSFQKFQEACHSPKFETVDWQSTDRDLDIHILFEAMNKLMSTSDESMSSLMDQIKKEELLKVGRTISGQLNHDLDEKKFLDMINNFTGSIPPLVSIIGGLASQEVLKACTRKFRPFHQFLFISARNSQKSAPSQKGFHNNDRYLPQSRLIGEDLQQHLQSMKLIVVGAGAIGCEVMKNLALMGVGLTSEQGEIFLVDMDHIEKSNLSRQFLYRTRHIGQPKSIVAADQVSKINPSVSITPFHAEFNEQNESTFSDSLLSNCSLGIMALDNVQARKYFSSRCVENLIPHMDTGTMGTEGSFDVFYPFKTPTYNCYSPPKEQQIPMCTLKFFPYETKHAILWARDLFETTFSTTPEQLIHILNNKESDSVSVSPEVNELLSLLESKTCPDYAHTRCITWARNKWVQLFRNSILQINHDLPEDHLVDGTRFWAGNRKIPTPLNLNNDALSFILAAAHIMCKVIGVECYDDTLTKKILLKQLHQELPEFVPIERGNNIESWNNEVPNDATINPVVIQECLRISGGRINLNPVFFDKDMDNNYHVQFVMAAANNRAKNYGLTLTTKLETKLIAGRIIPAIATTTSVIAGFACLQLYNIGHNTEFESLRMGGVNLGIPFVQMMLPDEPFMKQLSCKETCHCAWDRFMTYENDIKSVTDLVNHFLEKENLTLTLVSYANKLLYRKGHFVSEPVLSLRQVLANQGEILPVTKLRIVLNARCAGMKEGDWMPPIHYILSH